MSERNDLAAFLIGLLVGSIVASIVAAAFGSKCDVCASRPSLTPVTIVGVTRDDDLTSMIRNPTTTIQLESGERLAAAGRLGEQGETVLWRDGR